MKDKLEPQQPADISKAVEDLKLMYGEDAPDDSGSLAAWNKTEPQQRGELASNPYQFALDQYAVGDAVYHDSVLMGKGFKNGSEAQLAHDKQRMVSIDWLDQSCPHSEPLALVTRRECDECMEELTR